MLGCVQVFFLTCAGTKVFSDPRMTSVDAALAFAKSSQLQVCPPTISRFPQYMLGCLKEGFQIAAAHRELPLLAEVMPNSSAERVSPAAHYASPRSCAGVAAA